MNTKQQPVANGTATAALLSNKATSRSIKVDTNVGGGEKKEPVVIDAGLRSLDHYKRALPKWRYDMRQRALPLIRWETPYLAWLQDRLRSPALDSYFAITANLGTHTFFMIGLPILFWCGNASFGQGLVRILASGVFFTGFIKDFFSLPRPLSPPLHRITMSGSAALEYGFPSTHSANAVSVVVYAVLCLWSPENTLSASTKTALEALAYFYAVSIVFGRLYCGMHGFVDVVVGSVMGAVISLIEFYYGPSLIQYMEASGWTGVLVVLLTIIVLVRVHPEPADDCPCFDDSVAFAGVMIGLEPGCWHFAQSSYAAIPFDIEALGWPAAVARILLGVLVIFAWREVAKPSLLKGLPHLFRLIETAGLDLPRRFFKPASEYKYIPARLRVDNVMPNMSDLPQLITAVRHPRRGRSVSVGPQSAADAYETLAYRERRRRESIGSNASSATTLRNKGSISEFTKTAVGTPAAGTPVVQTEKDSELRGQNHVTTTARSSAVSPADFERLMGEGTVVVSPADIHDQNGEPEMYIGQQDELGEKEVFSKLVKPRVRYDVEVVAKLVVYAGIAWFAVEGVPLLYQLIPGLRLKAVI